MNRSNSCLSEYTGTLHNSCIIKDPLGEIVDSPDGAIFRKIRYHHVRIPHVSPNRVFPIPNLLLAVGLALNKYTTI